MNEAHLSYPNPGQTNSGSAEATRSYSSRIIKASALLPDSWTLLLSWEPSLSLHENLRRVLQENLLGKPSRSRADDVLAIFRQRFLSDAHLADSLAFLAHAGPGRTFLNRILYFYAARADRLLYDVVTNMLVPWFQSGHLAVAPSDIGDRIQQWVDEGKTTGCWSADTVRRVARGVLATLRDFEVLGGKSLKRITPPQLPAEAAAFIAFVMTSEGVAASELTSAEDWQLFFLEPASVERLLLEAHQLHLLSYAAAGRIVRLDFPAETLESYARVIAQSQG